MKYIIKLYNLIINSKVYFSFNLLNLFEVQIELKNYIKEFEFFKYYFEITIYKIITNL